MPPEIMDFDVQKHGQILENAPDPREKRMKGEARFPFGETNTTSLAMNTQIGMELGRSKRLFLPRTLTWNKPLTVTDRVQGAGTSNALVLRRPRDRNRPTRETMAPFAQKVGWTLPSPGPQLQIDQLKQSGEPKLHVDRAVLSSNVLTSF